MYTILETLFVIGCVAFASGEQQAVVKIVNNGTSKVDGVVYFKESTNGILVTGNITGLTPGSHGFHVHAIGDISGGCLTTGAHFNPKNVSHGGPNATVRHVGDLGNIEADETGLAVIKISDSIIALSGENSIIGRGIVIHEDPDDFGLTDASDSKTTGHAGARVGCGVIGTLSESSSANTVRSTILVAWILVVFACLVRTL
ncbi:hypothetical protein YQE_11411, partial [Dendroctonus ponderosae]